MRFYQGTHEFYAGIDLHTKVMYVCVLDQGGQTVVHRNIPARPEPLLELLAPYRRDVVVAAECTFSWYWLADCCANEQIPFVLGHALYMKAIHGGKAMAFVQKRERKHGKGKAMSILAARLGRAIYTMLKRREAFDEDRFFAGV